MPYRTDKFEVNDLVTWFDDEYATAIDSRSQHGDGPFKVIKVFDRENELIGEEQSLYEAMGHTQHVVIDLGYGEDINQMFSGAYFKKI